MIHIFESEFHSASPRTPVQQLRIAAPIATELLAEAAREIDADTAPLAAQAMIRIETAVGIMRRLPPEIIDAPLDLTLADLSSAVMIGIYDGAYIRRLTAQMSRQISQITSFEDDRIWLDELICTPAPSCLLTAPPGYDRAAVLTAVEGLWRCAAVVSGGGYTYLTATDLKSIGRSLMHASRDLRYALAAEALMHMSSKGRVTAPRLEALASALADDVDRVTSDHSILGLGPLPLSIRHLDDLLAPPPADPAPPTRSRNRRPKKPWKPGMKDIYDELRAIKSLI